MTWEEPHPRYLPSAEETKVIETDIRHLDEEILKLTRQIDDLVDLRSDLQRQRSLKLAFIASFRRLPGEILAEIALQCIELGESPFRLTHICASMRDAVIGIKPIWSTIHLVPQQFRMGADPKDGILCFKREHLEIILDRAHPLPLTVTMQALGSIHDLIQAIALAASSIRTLRIIDDCRLEHQLPVLDLASVQNIYYKETGGRSMQIDQICDMIGKSHESELVIHLEVGFKTLCQVIDHSVFSRVVGATISLKSGVNGYHHLLRTNKTVLPHLKYLELRAAPHVFLFQIVMPNLEFLRVDGDQLLCILELQDLPPTLQSLELENITLFKQDPRYKPGCFDQLLKVRLSHVNISELDPEDLLAPQLEEMDLSDINVLTTLHDEHPFFGHCKLKKLSFHSTILDSVSIPVIEKEAALVELNLTECMLSRGFLEWLSGCQRGILANLTGIKLTDCRCREDDYSLTEFAESVSMGPPVHLQIM